jgi:hypothetical protein
MDYYEEKRVSAVEVAVLWSRMAFWFFAAWGVYLVGVYVCRWLAGVLGVLLVLYAARRCYRALEYRKLKKQLWN